MASSAANDPINIAYATPDFSRRSYWPAGILCATGLGLVALGGCFLIGVMLLTTAGFSPAKPTLTTSQVGLMVVLYCLAFACFAGAVLLILKAILLLR